MTKAFNIGEYCQHGTIVVTSFGREDKGLKVQFCNYKKPSEVMEEANFFDVLGSAAEMMWMRNFLEDRTTPFYADKVINHIKKKLS